MKDCCSNNKSTIDINDRTGLICYCFQKSKQELFEAVKAGTEKEVVDDIKAKMKDPGCFCEKSNPSGKCCLADVTAFIKAAQNL